MAPYPQATVVEWAKGLLRTRRRTARPPPRPDGGRIPPAVTAAETGSAESTLLSLVAPRPRHSRFNLTVQTAAEESSAPEVWQVVIASY